MAREPKTRLSGLERYGLNEASLRRLANRQVSAYVHLSTYQITPAVRRLLPGKRLAYLSRRVERWIDRLHRLFPELSFKLHGKLTGKNVRRWSNLPSTLEVRCAAAKLSRLAEAAGVDTVEVSRIAGIRPRRKIKPKLEWYCVRALVVIRVEAATGGLQSTEDRFVLVRASSFDDAEKRLRKQWVDYASPYLNSDGRIVSWQFDHVVDVYQTGETEIDERGTEVYSKLRGRRMSDVWRPRRTGPLFKLKH